MTSETSTFEPWCIVAEVGPLSPVPMAGGSCLMTPAGIPFAAAVTPPASLAPEEECI